MGPATRFARAARRWEPDDWWRLEARAWESHPQVRRAIAFSAPASVWKVLATDSVSLRSAGGCLTTLLNVFGMSAPLLALLAAVGWFFSQPRIPFPLAAVGVLLLLGVLSSLGDMRSSLRGSVFTDPRSARILAVVHLVPSALLMCFAVPASLAHLPIALLPLLAIAADIAVGIGYIVLYPVPTDERSARWRMNQERLEHALAALTEDECEQIRRDIGYAFDDLERRELVDPAALAHARAVPLGRLGIEMARPASV